MDLFLTVWCGATGQLDRLQAGRLQALQTGEGGASAGGQDATEVKDF